LQHRLIAEGFGHGFKFKHDLGLSVF